MHLQLQAELPCDVETAWPWLVDPELMNQWSTARIEATSPGDRGLAWSTGALRQVHVPAPFGDKVLKEVVEHVEPGRRFVYRVYGGIPARYHRGEMALTGGNPCHLTWTVDADFYWAATEMIAKRLLQRELNASLRRLEGVVAPVKSVEWTSAETLGHLPPKSLWEEAERIRAGQEALANSLRDAGDPRYWFTRVYQYVTEAQLEACKRGAIQHVEWVLQLIASFDRYYLRSLEPFIDGRPEEVEEHWATAFAAMGRHDGKYTDDGYRLFRGLQLAIEAHIEFDLPRCLQEVYLGHFAERCDYVRFRSDYILMAPLFLEASERIIEEIPASYLPLSVRLLGKRLPERMRLKMYRERFYDVARKRMQAFEKGHELLDSKSPA